MNELSTIRPAQPGDADAIWRILEPTIREGRTYPLPRDMSRPDALAYWFAAGHEVFVAERDEQIAGTYYLKANQRGGGSHVANCGFMTAGWMAGRGVGAEMCRHALQHARTRGFTAMQFNFVVSSNDRAVALWKRIGFDVVGRVPNAFNDPDKGFVDALVMYRTL